MSTQTPTTRIDQTLLDAVCDQAAHSPRLRQNANFHPANTFPAHRLINAVQPGSYIRPHRHQHPDKNESIVVLRGRFGYLRFSDDGTVAECLTLTPDGPVYGVDIAHGTWHTLLALTPDSVFFEAKAGPFVPLAADEIAGWAPPDGTPEAAALWQTWRGYFD